MYMTVNHQLAPNSSAAFAFPDLLEFGMEARLHLPPSEIARIAARIERQGYENKRAKTKQAALHSVLSVPVTLQSGACFKVRLELFFERIDDERIRLTNRSKISLNGMQLLRLMLGMEGWPIGFDGRENVAGPTSEHAVEQVEELLLTIESVIEKAIDALRSLMPAKFAVEEEHMWLRKAELAHDAVCADPTGTTTAIGQSSFRGAIASLQDVYRQGISSADGAPVVRFRLSKSRVDLKIYGKTGELLRHEVSCLRRGSVVAVTGAERGDIGGDTAVALVVAFMAGAMPLLIDLVRHVEQVKSELVSPSQLIVELSTLVELTLADNQWSADAAAAWNSFVLTGAHDAKGKRKGTIFRDVLEGLTGPEGPLLHGARPTLYHLHPRLVQRTLR